MAERNNDFSDYAQLIANALESFDRPTVESNCAALSALVRESQDPCPLQIAVRVLQSLRNKRYFDLMQTVADSLLQGGLQEAVIWRLYSQALIDSGQLALAKEQLLLVKKKYGDDIAESVEIDGLLGRVCKQFFVCQCNQPEKAATSLSESVQWYRTVYDRDTSNIWHGINAAAMLARAGRDGLTVPNEPDPAAEAKIIAAQMLNNIEELWLAGTATMWDMGTAAEACIALDAAESAAIWTERYVREPMADSFELASTRRQFIEIWQLSNDAGPGALVLPILEAQLLKKSGGMLTCSPGSVEATVSDATRNTLESILGRERYVSYKFMLRALDCARSVARIEDESERGIGTGFLMLGRDLDPKLGDEKLLLTNCHVVSDDPYVTNPPALAPEEAIIVFGPGAEYTVADVIWSSPPNRLDAAVLRLEGDLSDFEPLRIAKRLPLADGEQRVYIIGHPRGGDLSFSIHDNALIDHEGPPEGVPSRDDIVRIHYRAPTEGGSSGSPVFNSQWRAIGLHHAGGVEMPRLNGNAGTHPANEGLWLQSISNAIKGGLA